MIGEIRLFAGNFAPVGWAFAHGQLLPISEYDPLFQLIGTTYGGDGQTTFGLPDTRGTEPACANYVISLFGVFAG
jgi:microcystin-dependent protein